MVEGKWQESAKISGNAEIWDFGIFLTVITIVISIVSRIESLLFMVDCLVAFREAIIPGNHETSKPAS